MGEGVEGGGSHPSSVLRSLTALPLLGSQPAERPKRLRDVPFGGPVYNR